MSLNRIRNLDLTSLRSFVTIIEMGSMTRAAGRLHLTQSAISMQIKRLESSLDVALLERSSQGMTATSEGEHLLQYARQMLALNDEAIGRLTSPVYQGMIRFAAPSDVVHPYIPQVLKDFSRDYPRVQVQFSTGLTARLLNEFKQGLHEIVLTTERDPGAEGEVLLTLKLDWVGAANGNAWKRRPLPIGFSKHCMFRTAVTRALDSAGIPWVDFVVTEDDLAIEALVTADLCVHAHLETFHLSDMALIDHGGQLPPLPDHSIALYHSPGSGGEISDTLLDYLRQAFK